MLEEATQGPWMVKEPEPEVEKESESSMEDKHAKLMGYMTEWSPKWEAPKIIDWPSIDLSKSIQNF